MPMVIDLKEVPLPAEGTYSIEILVDSQLQRTLTFRSIKGAPPVIQAVFAPPS
jgi:hypothetical protein